MQLEYLLHFIVFVLPVILFVCFLFIFWYLLNNTKFSEIKRFFLTVLGSLVSVFVSMILIFLLVLAAIFYYPARPFDSSEWLTEVESRYELADDLVNRKILIGKSKIEVENLLGDNTNNNPEGYFNRKTDKESDEWTYYIGYKPSTMRIDASFLVIEFQDGKVISVNQRSQ